jgi:2-polyprenyl-6-methoxyphenol hydroxylase-like FAD-dependent oxidoreductase
MANETYDIITVGGGLGGSALAKAMAEHGARVLVLERETQFKDRIRGEFMAPWGVAEAQALGIDGLLRTAGGQDLPYVDMYVGGVQTEHRDLRTTTVQGQPALSVYHPAMQEVVLQAAANAGAEVRRGVVVRDVKRNGAPTVTVEQDGRSEEYQARLVVGADGRGSLVRKWAGFSLQHDPEQMLIAGVLFENMPIPPDDANHIMLDLARGHLAPLFPQGQGKVRAYFACRTQGFVRLQGAADIPRFIEESVLIGVPSEWFAGARATGPLATFDGAATWATHSYHAGIVLIGDAAGASDPTWGQGLSLTLRDVRVLRDLLASHDDWDAAGHAYAQERDRYFNVINTVDNYQTELFFAAGGAADARRMRMLPLLAQEPTRRLDHNWSGPDLPLDETVRRRFFGEE